MDGIRQFPLTFRNMEYVNINSEHFLPPLERKYNYTDIDPYTLKGPILRTKDPHVISRLQNKLEVDNSNMGLMTKDKYDGKIRPDYTKMVFGGDGKKRPTKRRPTKRRRYTKKKPTKRRKHTKRRRAGKSS
jgi:hypothetical protein